MIEYVLLLQIFLQTAFSYYRMCYKMCSLTTKCSIEHVLLLRNSTTGCTPVLRRLDHKTVTPPPLALTGLHQRRWRCPPAYRTQDPLYYSAQLPRVMVVVVVVVVVVVTRTCDVTLTPRSVRGGGFVAGAGCLVPTPVLAPLPACVCVCVCVYVCVDGCMCVYVCIGRQHST